MATKQDKTSSAFTLKYFLIAAIVIGTLWIVGSIGIILIRNINNSKSIEETMQAARVVLLETQKKSANEGKSYTINFKNSSEGIQYLISHVNSPSEWKKLSSDTATNVQESNIVFDTEGNLKSPTRLIFFNYKKQQKCLIFDSNLKNIRQEEGSKCKV